MKGFHLKINLKEEKLGLYSRIPHSVYRDKIGGKRLKPSAVALAGKVVTFSGKESSCRLTYAQIREELGCARDTIANALNQLEGNGRFERLDRDQDGTAFKYKKRRGREYDVVPMYLYTSDIWNGETWRRISKAEVRVLGRLMTECAYAKNGGNPQNGGGTYRCSYKKLARELNLSETTVKKALYTLMKARLVYRSKENKGKNRYKVSGYEVNSRLYAYQNYIKKKAPSKKKEGAAKEIEDINARNDRSRYYQMLREAAQRRVDKYMAMAQRHEDFCNITKSLSGLEFKLAMAEVTSDVEGLRELEAEKESLQAKRRSVLRKISIDERMLSPIWKCARCADTGYLPNGKACDCYSPGGGL